MSTPAFRFGVNVDGAATRAAWTANAQRIEALGYDTLFLSDHVGTFPPIAGMVAAAMATTRLRVGSNVLANDFRHPLMLARELIATDVLSEGRLVCGLGAGFWRSDYEESGIPLDAPGVRIGRLEEAVQVVKAAFTQAPCSFEGTYYTVREASLGMLPIQRPHPPLLLGGGSPRVLALAAREADIVGVNLRTTAQGSFDLASISPEATAEKVAWVREAAGLRMGRITLSMLCPFAAVTEAPEQAAGQIAELWNGAGVAITAAQILASPHTLMGTVEQLVERVLRLRSQYGITFVVLPEHAVEAFAPIVARLSGT